jgi:hypothetical protein
LTDENRIGGIVLERAHTILEKTNTTLGEAIKQAQLETGLTISPELEEKLLVALFKVVVQGFPSKIDA